MAKVRHQPQRTLAVSAARALTLRAQGFDAPRSASDARATHALFARLGLLQLDSVNVLDRSHYLVAFARLGAYSKPELDRQVRHDLRGKARPKRVRYTEAWAHEAALVPASDLPLFSDRFERARAHYAKWFDEHAALVDAVLGQIRDEGPRTSKQIEHPSNTSAGGGWWNWNDVTTATHLLFRSGLLTVVGRSRFERVYDVPERALSDEHRRSMPRDEAYRELVLRAAGALGVATLADLHDYHRLRYLAWTRDAVDALVDEGALVPTAVQGWQQVGYTLPGVRVPRAVETVAVLSPFDPVVWHRPRALSLYDFHYRISIYTPAAQREHGYYVCPVLIDGDVVGRIDLKRDRAADALLVRHANIEARHAGHAAQFAARLAPKLHELASWQTLSRVDARHVQGTWASDLAAALR